MIMLLPVFWMRAGTNCHRIIYNDTESATLQTQFWSNQLLVAVLVKVYLASGHAHEGQNHPKDKKKHFSGCCKVKN